MVAREVVAAFDVDGTLTRRDCVLPFLWRLGATRLLLGLVRRAPAVLLAVARGDRDRLKQIATAAVFSGRPVVAAERVAETFGARIQRWLRADTLGRLRWHQHQGHVVVLVSASYQLYVDVLGRALGVDAVLATEVGRDGPTFTGVLVGGNCRGPEKLRRLDEWIASRDPNGGRDAVELWAYGDSAGDRELLAAADHPVWAKRVISSVPSTE